MGDIIRLNCNKCGFDEELNVGIGEGAYVSNYFCNDCQKVSSFWESHNFGGYDESPDFNFDDEPEAEPETQEAETPKEKCCKSCESRNIVEINEGPKSPCPKCGSKKIKRVNIGDWD